MQQRKLAVYIALLVAAAVLIAITTTFYETRVLSESARSYVLEDLRAKNPNADILDIISWETKVNGGGGEYYQIKASATEGMSTPCPRRAHYEYFYPEQNFIPKPPEHVVVGCRVCEGPGCVIAFQEEAVIASHTNTGSSAIKAYIEQYPDARPGVKREDGGWSVSWRSPSAPYGYEVQIENDGDIRRISRA